MSDTQARDTFDDFVRRLVRSRLVAAAKVEALLDDYRANFLSDQRWPDTIAAFGNYLVASGALTVWQCAKLRAGRWKGFFLGDLLLLDFIRQEGDDLICLARWLGDGTYVDLRITPPGATPGEAIKYEVVREYEN